jgi:hypothetical protein
VQQNNVEYSGFPQGGSVRLSGTVLHHSTEFQAVQQRTGEHQAARSGTAQRGRTEGAWPALRGLWE